MQEQEKLQEQQKPTEHVAQKNGQESMQKEPTSESASSSSSVEPDIEQKLAEVEKKAAEMQDAFLRAKADVENLRKRSQEETARAYKYAIEGFAESLVPVKDSLEMALQVESPSVESIKEGVEMTLKQLSSAFEKNRLLEVNPKPGEKLDPMQHQAISVVPADQDANTIVSVLQKGYKLDDRLLRPALVTVAQGKSSPQ